MNCLAGTVDPSNHRMLWLAMRRVRGGFHGRSPGLLLDYGFRCEGHFAAAREEVGRQRAAAAAAAAAAAVPSATAPPKKLRAKKQAATMRHEKRLQGL